MEIRQTKCRLIPSVITSREPVLPPVAATRYGILLASLGWLMVLCAPILCPMNAAERSDESASLSLRTLLALGCLSTSRCCAGAAPAMRDRGANAVWLLDLLRDPLFWLLELRAISF